MNGVARLQRWAAVDNVASGSQQSSTWSAVVCGRRHLPTATYNVHNHLHRLQPPARSTGLPTRLHLHRHLQSATSPACSTSTTTSTPGLLHHWLLLLFKM